MEQESITLTRRFLNVGGNSKDIAVPPHYRGWTHDLLDVEPGDGVDIVCDAREMQSLPPATYDAIYCSHTLEHFAPHDVPKVLSGFRHVLKPDGFAEIRVPDLVAVAKAMVEGNHQPTDVFYKANPGWPITFRDVIYGYAPKVSGSDFWLHRTGFSEKTLIDELRASGFDFGLRLQARRAEIAIAAFISGPVEQSLLISLRNSRPSFA